MRQHAFIGSICQEGLSGSWRAYLRHRHVALSSILLQPSRTTDPEHDRNVQRSLVVAPGPEFSGRRPSGRKSKLALDPVGRRPHPDRVPADWLCRNVQRKHSILSGLARQYRTSSPDAKCIEVVRADAAGRVGRHDGSAHLLLAVQRAGEIESDACQSLPCAAMTNSI